jgi:hypothetical protein
MENDTQPIEFGTLDTSPTVAKIADALAKAHLNYGTLIASQVADAEKYKYRYADLAGVLAAVQPALAKSGIAIVQSMAMTRPAGSSGLVVAVETRFIHASGEWIATTLKLPSTETAPQKVGSLVTYLRRYGLLALSACASEDDDGADAMPTPPKRASKPEAPRPVTPPAPTNAEVRQAAHPLPATELPPARKPRATKAAAPAPTSAFASASERGLIFKTAREQALTEAQVKALIFALFGYTSTTQIRQGVEFHKLINAMENPGDHGVAFDGDNAIYERERDVNALPLDVTEGM